MARRRSLLVPVLTLLLSASIGSTAAGVTGSTGQRPDPRGPSGPTDSFQPDGWIKLCGQSLGCVIDPLPHPWLGKDVYNTTGRKQTHADDINEGEGIRYWIALENDGTATDTFRVQGCRGTRIFELEHVLLGKHKRQDPGAEELTRRYKRGTLEFELDPGKRVFFTLQIVTHTVKNVTYRCRTEFTSQSDGSKVDVVVAKMTTF